MLEDPWFFGVDELAVGVDGWCVLDQLLLCADADVVRRHPRFEQRDEHESVAAHHAYLDRGEGGLRPVAVSKYTASSEPIFEPAGSTTS